MRILGLNYNFLYNFIMKQSIFFALFFLLIQNTGSIAQRIMWYEIDTSQNLVISPNGLKIRNKPGQEGDVLATVPFGKQVKVLSQKIMGRIPLVYICSTIITLAPRIYPMSNTLQAIGSGFPGREKPGICSMDI